MRLKNIFKKGETKIIILDLLMMFLLIINLNLILFDWLFASVFIQNILKEYVPGFFNWYNQKIHLNFILVDMGFVTIFIIELSIRWIIAIKNKTYHSWFFFPFIHWYDILGCIPVGSFRFLRILRVISIILRLQRLQIIDISKSYVYGKFIKYVNIVTEELSDRVVIHVLDEFQDEIKKGNPVTDRIITEVIIPQKTALVNWLSQKIQRISSDAHSAYNEDIRAYVNKLIEEAVDQNREISDIERIPVLGSIIASNLEKVISDIVFSVVNNMIQDLASTNNKIIVEDLADLTFDSFLTEEGDRELNRIAKDAVLQAIDLLKEQVQVQQWKLRDMEKKEAQIKSRLDKEILEHN